MNTGSALARARARGHAAACAQTRAAARASRAPIRSASGGKLPGMAASSTLPTTTRGPLSLEQVLERIAHQIRADQRKDKRKSGAPARSVLASRIEAVLKAEFHQHEEPDELRQAWIDLAACAAEHAADADRVASGTLC